MGLKRNISANYVSQIYVAAVGILTVPLYLRHMGTEAYGLIGFYTMLQAWFQLLDTGLSTTLARESARFNGGGSDARHLVHLRQLLEAIFLAIAGFGLVSIWLIAPLVTTRWLQVNTLALSDVVRCVQLMGIVVACRWMSCLYRGVITGFEQQVWLSGCNTAVATARFVLCLPLIIYLDARPSTYFYYQAVVAAVEALVLYTKCSTLVPSTKSIGGASRDWGTLRPTLRFASGVAFTSVVWVLVTQVDKLVLSKMLPLSLYGEYTLAVLLSGGINLLSAPISTALLPRLTNTVAAGDVGAVHGLYRRFTQVVGLVTMPAAVTLMALGPQVLFAWTGNAAVSHSAAPVLGYYSLGNAVLGITAFAYYIQYAKGDIRMHLLGNAVFAVLYLPTVVLAAQTYGAQGAAMAWLAMNLLYLFCWVPLVHQRLMPGQHLHWLAHDVLPMAIASAVPWAIVGQISLPDMNRLASAAAALVFVLASLACALASSSTARSWLSRRGALRTA